MLVVNGAVEIPFSDRWTLNIPLYWSGWDYFSETRKFRCLLIQPEVRYYPIRNCGFFIGVHAGTGYYNCAWSRSQWRYQDKYGKTPLLNAGLGLGYRHALGHSDRWMLEYSIGGGYVNTDYDRFYNIKNGEQHDALRTHRLMPDHAGVSLVYRLSGQKGGSR